MSNHEVISAFLDDEPFDAGELGHALAESGGRELLLDLLALQAVVREDGAELHPRVAAAATTGPKRAWWIVAAAAVFLAAAGGFAIGSLTPAKPAVSTAQSAPEPTHILKLETGVNWKESQSPKGGE